MLIEIPVFPAQDFRLTLLRLDDDGRARLGTLGPLLGLHAHGRTWAQLTGLWLCGGAPGVAVLSPEEIDGLPHFDRLRIDRGGRLHLGRFVRLLSMSHWLAALVDDRAAQLFLINADRAAAGLMGLVAMTARDAVTAGALGAAVWTRTDL